MIEALLAVASKHLLDQIKEVQKMGKENKYTCIINGKVTNIEHAFLMGQIGGACAACIFTAADGKCNRPDNVPECRGINGMYRVIK